MKNNENGFSAVESLLVIVIVALIGVVGYMVYHNAHKSNPTTVSTSKTHTQTAKNKPASNPSSFSFKELGIKFTPTASLSGLHYTVIPASDDMLGGAYLADASTDAAFNKCLKDTNGANVSNDASSASFAGITKESGTYPTDANDSPELGPLVKQFDGFYVTIGYPNGEVCQGTQADQDQWGQAKRDAQQDFLQSLTKTIQEN
jgi:Tfp pilus assembly protein PilE